ncbi:hypothetical protein [Paraburkholderia kirstenboschensis]|uniref:Uncharacterized protein n=1 Tax=Paraburkholderia kirstenboschensis TaxID=1245436 RepID=A0ABZ0EIJ9_9BURK|nr:hypothetical protein [Paraburkholderia kirstenboschensis]WOD16770.1 hypothetical protein RW095_12905 [Paraburkholderia kirstenboschensis]
MLLMGHEQPLAAFLDGRLHRQHRACGERQPVVRAGIAGKSSRSNSDFSWYPVPSIAMPFTLRCVLKMNRALPDFVPLASRLGQCTPALAENTVSLAVIPASIELKVGCLRPILGLWFFL